MQLEVLFLERNPSFLAPEVFPYLKYTILIV